MFQQLTFIHEGVRYITIFGATDYLKTFTEPDSNCCNFMKLQGSAGAKAAFKTICKTDPRDVPIVTEAQVTKVGNVFNVKGKVSYNEKDYDVVISESGIAVNGEEVTKEEPVVTKEIATPVIPKPEVKEEPKPQVKEEPKPEVKEESKPATPEEYLRATVTDNSVDSGRKVFPESPGLVLRTSKKPAGISFVEEQKPTHGINLGTCITPSSVKDVEPNNANDEEHVAEVITGLTLGIPRRSRKVQGITVGEFTPKRYTKPVIIEAEPEEEIIEKPVSCPVEEQVLVEPKTEEEINEELMEKWRASMPTDISDNWQKPESGLESKVETTVVESEVVDNKQLKEALRSSYSDEVNAVIGQIPHAILGLISEFTTNPVNVSRLEAEGDTYCIDNRWHKCGKWYCIDVVEDHSRYFYNSKLKVSIAIPNKICKEWLSAVS